MLKSELMTTLISTSQADWNGFWVFVIHMMNKLALSLVIRKHILKLWSSIGLANHFFDARTQRPELEWRVRAGASCVENVGVEQEADAHLEALAIAGTAGWHAGVPSKHAP